MKLSRNFLKDYIDIKNLSDHDLAEAMTKVGNEYDSITPLVGASHLVVGYVKECKNHPDSDHMHVCQVEVGQNDVRQIVCGAPNIKEGQKVIVSLPGAVLPNGMTIKKSMIRGVESDGMICSLGEIGIEHKYQSEADQKGIHVLEEDAEIGTDPIAYLCFDDTTIDFELTANRADLLSVLGMAYEVGAILNEKVKLPETKLQTEVERIEDHLQIDIQTENCPLYLARLVKGLKIAPSPKWMQARLMASGIRPINNVVDISNYVMLEEGQPLHFFDYRTLGNKIVVRMAEEGEKLTTLDGKERNLSREDIVIANDDHAVGLAGVMGGLNSEVEQDTQDIVIESAIFNPLKIRYTAKKILRSEASARFEKGLDPNRTYLAMARACYLLEKLAGGTVVKGTLAVDHTNHDAKVIPITKEKINRVLGMSLTNQDILDVFHRLDFEVQEQDDSFTVTVPTRRVDIAIEEDLIEEVGRIHGIDQCKGTLPVTTMKNGTYEEKYKKEKLIQKHLEALGLYQVRTYTLVNQESVNMFTDDEFTPIVVRDPLTEDHLALRYSLLPSLLEVASYNLARKVKNIPIFEISDVYYTKDKKTMQTARLAALITGTMLENTWNHIKVEADFFYMKGILENLLNYLGLNRRYTIETGKLPKEYHPYQSAIVKIDQDVVGYIGMVHPTLSKTPLYVFELDLSKVEAIQVRGIKDKEISKYPTISKDFAFLVENSVSAKSLLDTIQKTGGRLLTNIEVFDVYQGENIAEGKKSIAFNLTFMDPTRTLNEEEVMEIFNKIIEQVEKEHNAELRDK